MEEASRKASKGALLHSHKLGAFITQELGNRNWIIPLQRHFLQVREHHAPLFFGRQVAIVAADEILEDAALQFVPG